MKRVLTAIAFLLAASSVAYADGLLAPCSGVYCQGPLSLTNGQLPIGSSVDGRAHAATITAGSNITVTNGAGTITISAAGGGGSGCIPSGLLGQLIYNDGSGGCNSLSTVTTDGTLLNFSNGALALLGSSSGTSILEAPATGGGTSALPAGSGTLLYNALADGDLFVGSSGGVATAKALSGDCALVNSGAITCTKTNGTSFGYFATGTDAANLTGTVPASQLPLPGAASLGGVFSKAVVSHNFLTGISSVDGSVSQAQPACGDLSNAAASCATDATNASNITSGTLPNARIVALPNTSLANSATTVNGQTCTLGSSCTITAAATGVTVGITTITTGTDKGLLYDNSGVLGNLATANSGVLVTSGVGVPSISTTLPDGLALGTPGSVTLTNGTGLPVSSGISGLGTGIATWLGTPSSANLRAALTDETGTGLAYFQGGDIGTPSAGVGSNLTALNASNLSSGTVAAARGGAGTINGALKGNGSGVVSQAACADLSNGGTMCTQSAGGVAITGGTIDNAAIGGSTPAAGAFTAVTTASMVGGVGGSSTLGISATSNSTPGNGAAVTISNSSTAASPAGFTVAKNGTNNTVVTFLTTPPTSSTGDDFLCMTTGFLIRMGTTCAASSEKVKDSIYSIGFLQSGLGVLFSDPVGWTYNKNAARDQIGKPGWGYTAQRSAALERSLGMPKGVLAVYGDDGQPWSIQDRGYLAMQGQTERFLLIGFVLLLLWNAVLTFGLLTKRR